MNPRWKYLSYHCCTGEEISFKRGLKDGVQRCSLESGARVWTCRGPQVLLDCPDHNQPAVVQLLQTHLGEVCGWRQQGQCGAACRMLVFWDPAPDLGTSFLRVAVFSYHLSVCRLSSLFLRLAKSSCPFSWEVKCFPSMESFNRNKKKQ